MLQGNSPVRLFQGAIAGALVTMVIGFGWAGWTLGGTATKMADEASTRAVTAALAPICVEKFQHTANSEQNLAQLKKTVSYEQGTFVEKGGWATLPGSDASNYAVAQACATMLSNLK
jgi:flagellar motor component MotA